MLHQYIEVWSVWAILSETILAIEIFSFVCSKTQLWQQSLSPGAGLEINIASFLYHWAHCLLPLHYLLHPPFFPIFSLSSLSPSCHIFLKNWRHRREIDVMKNNWGISMSHLLCHYGHPRSPQHGSRLSVAIGAILQISQQLSEVTSQVHH